MLINIEKKQYQIRVDEKIDKSIIVCSHERSGTHFLMNSISLNSEYSVDPYLNFDLAPLGDTVNFFSTHNVANFIDKICTIDNKNKKYGLSSLIKSHHPPYVFENLFDKPKVIFLYIYRDPVETLLSFWRFINHWDWHEGPKLDKPLDFIKAKPEGQMQRYQKKSYDNIFLRWAYHLSDWIEVSKKYNNILLINYKDLNINYNLTMRNIFKFLKLPEHEFSRPAKDNYINTKKLDLQNDDKAEIISFIYKNISKFPELEKIFKVKT